MNGYPKFERERAFERVMTHLNHMLALLKATQYENNTFHLGVDLPAEQSIVTAMSDCARLYKQTGEKTASGT